MSIFKIYIQENNITLLHTLRLDDIYDFHDDYYKNILLFTCRLGSYEALVVVCNKIIQFQPIVLTNFLQTTDQYQRSALDLAAIDGKTQKLSYLIDTFGLLIKRDVFGYSALTHAICRNNIEAFYYLLIKKAAFNEIETSKINQYPTIKNYLNSPIGFLKAIQTQNINLFSWVYRFIKGLGLDYQKPFCTVLDSEGRNVLMIAAQFNDFTIFNELLSLPFDVSFKDFNNKTLSQYLNENYFYSKKNKERFLALTTTNSSKQSGYWPKAFPEKKCSKRPFNHERERQLLKQVATQLFFAFKHYLTITPTELIELQVLHINCLNKHKLFIACNQSSIASELPKFIPNMYWLSHYLAHPYTPKSDREGNIRSMRYAKKLNHRIYQQASFFHPVVPNDDLNQTQHICNILRVNHPIGTLLYNNDKNVNHSNIANALHSDIAIYLVNSQFSSQKTRHAEEFLADIVDSAQLLDSETYSCIAGKKRPCMSCSGRMSSSGVNNFGAHPGRLWKEAFLNQNHKQARHTAICLLSNPAHYTEKLTNTGAVQKLPDYDSESDSEFTLNYPHRI